MSKITIYLIFHLAAGFPLCLRAFKGQPFGFRFFFRWFFGLIFWPIPAAGALYEVVRDEIKGSRNEDSI